MRDCGWRSCPRAGGAIVKGRLGWGLGAVLPLAPGTAGKEDLLVSVPSVWGEGASECACSPTGCLGTEA